MLSPANYNLARFAQYDWTPAQSPATVMAADSHTAISQPVPVPSLNHKLPRGLLPQVASAHRSTGSCHPSPALAALLMQRNHILFSYNHLLRILPNKFSPTLIVNRAADNSTQINREVPTAN